MNDSVDLVADEELEIEALDTALALANCWSTIASASSVSCPSSASSLTTASSAS